MKKVLEFINEIKKYEEDIIKTKSKYLKSDLTKKIKKMKKELQQYCEYKKINYGELVKKYGF